MSAADTKIDKLAKDIKNQEKSYLKTENYNINYNNHNKVGKMDYTLRRSMVGLNKPHPNPEKPLNLISHKKDMKVIESDDEDWEQLLNDMENMSLDPQISQSMETSLQTQIQKNRHKVKPKQNNKNNENSESDSESDNECSYDKILDENLSFNETLDPKLLQSALDNIHMDFEQYNEFDGNNDENSQVISDSYNQSITECNECNIAYVKADTYMYCPKCGEERELMQDIDVSHMANNDHNTSDNSFVPFKIVGKNSYCFQKSFLKCCANYNTYRNNNNKKDMFNCVYQYKGNKIPKDVMQDAMNLYKIIRDNGHVYRGNGKKGIMGACLFYACIMKNITKTPREIAAILNIEERFLSQGDRVLQELNEKNIIKIPTLLRPLEDYLTQYFPALGIDNKYIPFVADLIRRAEKKNLHICVDSRTTTKCVGAIYMLVMRIRELRERISRDTIIKECKISKSTFLKYYNLLCENHDKLKHVFKKHRIPMPTAWRTPKTPPNTPSFGGASK